MSGDDFVLTISGEGKSTGTVTDYYGALIELESNGEDFSVIIDGNTIYFLDGYIILDNGNTHISKLLTIDDSVFGTVSGTYIGTAWDENMRAVGLGSTTFSGGSSGTFIEYGEINGERTYTTNGIYSVDVSNGKITYTITSIPFIRDDVIFLDEVGDTFTFWILNADYILFHHYKINAYKLLKKE